MSREKQTDFVVCLRNDGFEASLAIRKLYRVLPDRGAEMKSLIRVVDESGEDYLYPMDLFAPVAVPKEAAETLTSR